MISSIGSTAASNLFSAPLEGIRRGMNDAGEAAAKVAQGDVSPENVVAQIQAEVLVKANATAARTADEILGSLLDTVA